MLVSWAEMPRSLGDRFLAISQPDGVLIVIIVVAPDNQCAAAIMIRPIPLGWMRNSSTGRYASHQARRSPESRGPRAWDARD
jgi:hypothetical protein